MKNGLLFLAVVAALVFAVPAHSQYVFLDVDGDGLNSLGGGGGFDLLTSTTTHVDVYFVTNQNRGGSAAACPDFGAGVDPLTIFSYEFTLVASGSGSVTYGAWTDNMGFTFKLTPGTGPYFASGPAIWIARGGSVAAAPGKYKVGTLAVTVTGGPHLEIVPGLEDLHPNSATSFGSKCLGSNFDNTMHLGTDFFDADGTEFPVPATSTTWGRIKETYR